MPVNRTESTQIRSQLDIRLSPDIKDRIRRAAHILGQNLAEFTATTLDKRAVDILQEYDGFALTESEHDKIRL